LRQRIQVNLCDSIPVGQQLTVSLQCYGLSPNSPARDYWWGLEFYNASVSISIDDVIAINQSSSILQNVDIYYAGVSPNFDPVPAIRASPTIPALINVTISHMALDGTNFTEVLSPTIVFNSEIKNCRGMFVFCTPPDKYHGVNAVQRMLVYPFLSKFSQASIEGNK